MKRSSLKALATVIAGVAVFAGGRSILAQATNSVVNSLHNLQVSYGKDVNTDVYGDRQVCMPCHTPHQAPTANVLANTQPLWNHTLNAANTYTLFNGTTSSTSYLSTIDDTSRECLGCHDGTIAVDSYGSNPQATVTGTMPTGFIIGPNKNLQHEHPIDVLYNSSKNYVGVSTATVNGTSTTYTYSTTWSATARNNDPSSFKTTGYTSEIWSAVPYTVPAISAISFYTGSGSTQSVTVKDINQTGGTDTGTNDGATPTPHEYYNHTISVNNDYVYCVSCHDPHNNVYHFMKVPNDGSQICLTCHNK